MQGIELKPPKQIIIGDRANSPHAGIFQGKNTMFRQLNNGRKKFLNGRKEMLEEII